jgi:DNA ligase (NAD+)
MAALVQASADDYATVHGIGQTTADAVAAFLHEPRNRELIEHLQEVGVNTTEPVEQVDVPSLRGKTFVITGTHTTPRKELISVIERHGGRVTGSVTRTTSYVVLGEDPGSKADKAKELGIPTIDEQQLFTLAAAATDEN